MAKTRDVLTVKDIAEYLNLHPMTVYKYVKEGNIPAFKIGATWRIRRDSIKRWIRENEERGRKK